MKDRMKLSLSPELMVFEKWKDRMKLSLSPELMVFEKWKTGWNSVYHPELMVFWVVFQPGWQRTLNGLEAPIRLENNGKIMREAYSYTTFTEDPLHWAYYTSLGTCT
jgi:hypothetical protein